MSVLNLQHFPGIHFIAVGFPHLNPCLYHPITCSAHDYALLVHMDIKVWSCA